MKARPSVYERIYYDCITYHPGALQYLISIVGADRVLFGTDYPHQVHDMKGAMRYTGMLPPEQCQAIREGNARRIFIDVPADLRFDFAIAHGEAFVLSKMLRP